MASLMDILCSHPLNLKNKIKKIEHKKTICGSSKILKNVSWPINICLKYFLTPTKTIPPYILNVRFLINPLLKSILRSLHELFFLSFKHKGSPAVQLQDLEESDVCKCIGIESGNKSITSTLISKSFN